MNYKEFLKTKEFAIESHGFDIKESDINNKLYDFQKAIVKWAIKKGKACIFADCGLGKSFMQLEWGRLVGGKCLILAPLAVSKQTVGEGKKLGIVVNLCESQQDVVEGINITNYEKLHKFDASTFDSIILDESSILKSFNGRYRNLIIDSFKNTKYKLACTATPSPNDYMELGNHNEFLGIMSRTEMLSTFFLHDMENTSQWRLKKHAAKEFWRWVCSWAIYLRNPDELGYEGKGFNLPELRIHKHILRLDKPTEGFLIPMEASTLSERRDARKSSIDERCSFVLNLIHDKSKIVAQNRQGEQVGIHEGVSLTEHGQMEKNSRTASEGQCETTGALQDKSNLSSIGKRKSKALANAESSQTQATAHKEIQNNIAGNGSFVRKTEQLMRNLRVQQDGEKDAFPIHRPLSQNGEGSGDSLHELQSRTGAIQGQSTTIENGGHISREQWLIWVNLNDEGEKLENLIPNSIQVSGSDSDTHKEQSALNFANGTSEFLISKSRIYGFGLNLQSCHNMIFVGLSDSFEQYYQAVRRCWRFGQKNPVDVHIILSESETAILKNIERKQEDYNKMAEEMSKNTKDILAGELHQTKRMTETYKTDKAVGNDWTVYLGDCVETMAKIKDESVGLSLFSPPFSSLYTYSNSSRDMGNCKKDDEFMTHFGFLVKELFRVLIPGRMVAFHCMNLPVSKEKDGYIGIRDFRGDLIRMFTKEGFIFHSEVCIWKDPVIAMQRTKALGLLHKQIKKDSCMSRMGIPDYVVTMRKPGENPIRVTHTDADFPVDLWQKFASPVWDDIDPGDTLQHRSAREHDDERHICPLQLEVIRRCLFMWSKKGDLVLSPFAGIASEGFEAIKNGRKFVGIELKESYYNQAVLNLKAAEKESQSELLFA